MATDSVSEEFTTLVDNDCLESTIDCAYFSPNHTIQCEPDHIASQACDLIESCIKQATEKIESHLSSLTLTFNKHISVTQQIPPEFVNASHKNLNNCMKKSTTASLKEEDARVEHPLHFTVNHVPDIGNLFLFGFQQMMLVHLIAASFFSSGIATLIQTTLGLRLCILHGPSSTFLPSLLAFANMPENQCTTGLSTFVPEGEWTKKILLIQGSLLVSVLTFVFMGATGLVGQIAKMVGPITIMPLLLWLCLGLIPTLHEKMDLHWISIETFCILVAMGIFLENVCLPIPYFSFSKRSWQVAKTRLFGQFPYLIAIITSWFICFLLTITRAEPEDGEARTDKNHTLAVIAESPWFRVPYPGQFGLPQVSLGITFGFISSCIACMVENIGDYQACARVSHQRTPPTASVNRAIMCEGIGSLIAGSLGLGTGVTTYAENIALMHITRVVSRSTMQVAGMLLLLTGLFPKCAAALASIPDAVVGGVFAMGVAMITGVAISNLQNVDLRLTRNLSIMGTAILMGGIIPFHFEHNRVNTGLKTVDDCFNMLLTIPMLIAGVIAFVLDNTVGGATREQRGFASQELEDKTSVEDDGYALPETVRKILRRHPCLCKLPFLPSRRSILASSSSCNTTSSYV
ncbi:unnamed protein product [Cylicocyclus nassatus]|uniref:Uncharacterized protein n=1 Tax=Cylicocyclus nassatus TaxID=53992 RepID=A0AA36H2Z0_CYLNA|nr:unnamed protein product [Cylicocyclus nassatus]